MIHGGRVIKPLKEAGVVHIRTANVPVAVVSGKPDEQWDKTNRAQLGGGKGWAVCVYSDVGNSKKDFI